LAVQLAALLVSYMVYRNTNHAGDSTTGLLSIHANQCCVRGDVGESLAAKDTGRESRMNQVQRMSNNRRMENEVTV
jgi:hypothetical protein